MAYDAKEREEYCAQAAIDLANELSMRKWTPDERGREETRRAAILLLSSLIAVQGKGDIEDTYALLKSCVSALSDKTADFCAHKYKENMR